MNPRLHYLLYWLVHVAAIMAQGSSFNALLDNYLFAEMSSIVNFASFHFILHDYLILQ